LITHFDGSVNGNVPTTRDELISIYDSGNGPYAYGTYVFTAGVDFELV